MTRDMLIKLLHEDHSLDILEAGPDDDYGIWFCTCGVEMDNPREHAEHVADLILLGFAR